MFEEVMTNFQGKVDPMQVLKDMFDKAEIDIKTEFNIDQIRTLIHAKFIILRLTEPQKDPLEHFGQVLEEFKVMMCSFERKSRKEAIKAISSFSPVPENDSIQNAISGK